MMRGDFDMHKYYGYDMSLFYKIPKYTFFIVMDNPVISWGRKEVYFSKNRKIIFDFPKGADFKILHRDDTTGIISEITMEMKEFLVSQQYTPDNRLKPVLEILNSFQNVSQPKWEIAIQRVRKKMYSNIYVSSNNMVVQDGIDIYLSFSRRRMIDGTNIKLSSIRYKNNMFDAEDAFIKKCLYDEPITILDCAKVLRYYENESGENLWDRWFNIDPFTIAFEFGTVIFKVSYDSISIEKYSVDNDIMRSIICSVPKNKIGNTSLFLAKAIIAESKDEFNRFIDNIGLL